MSTFANKVVAIVKAIPAGEVKTYKQVGEEAGSPNAGRAVGAILIPLHIEDGVPWHRVVKADGTVQAGGTKNPVAEQIKWTEFAISLLKEEGVAFDRSNRVAYLAAASDKAAGRSLKRPDPTPCWKHETVQYSCRDCR